MPNKNTQYKNRASRQYGSGSMDLDDKNKVKRILKSLGADGIHFDWFIGIKYDDGTLGRADYDLYEMMTESETKYWDKIRHPDVICTTDFGTLIVEIDGKYHKDYDYDTDYDLLKPSVRYIKINKAFLKQEKITWKDWIVSTLDSVYGVKISS